MCKRRMHLGWGACGSSWPAAGWIADLSLAKWDEKRQGKRKGKRKGRGGEGYESEKEEGRAGGTEKKEATDAL